MPNSRKLRRELVDDYLASHNGKALYEEVEEDTAIRGYQLEMIREILRRLYEEAPVDTGYGRVAGIRYTKLSDDRYRILIGSTTDAHGGQIANAPYMAIQNFFNPWIDIALWYAHNLRRKYGLVVVIEGPYVMSHYITANGAVRPSGYYIDIVFMGKRNVNNRIKKYSNAKRRLKNK